jgi:hypothetical protein
MSLLYSVLKLVVKKWSRKGTTLKKLTKILSAHPMKYRKSFI